MSTKWGRPPTFTDQDRLNFAELIRRHGARGARAAASVPVSLPTLLKIAREFEITLKKGKRPRRAA